MPLIGRRLATPLLAATLAMFLLPGAAARDATQATRPAAAHTAPVPLLWKVSDDDNALYLLGSFHLLMPDDYPLSSDVDLAFADAEKVLFELSPEEMASPQLGLQMAQAAMRTDGTTLDSQLPADLARKLASWSESNAGQLAKLGMAPAMLQMFEPWFAGLMITISQLTGYGLDPALGLDAHIAARAGTAQKPTAGLESGAQQIAFLDGMGADEQLQMLSDAIDQGAAGREEMMALHAAWRAGDVDLILREMVAEMRREYPELYRVINVERNDAWLPKLEQRLREDGSDDTLVVVGAMHLLGEDGVVEKLRARGYQVERICSACTQP
ncbi:TraB/GumN family protein [Luteimonas sp. MC1828]|uniref:TraB/GumN family protein n=1 Tax=Luteimonas sp. MC1828 TaxID=2799787 RepID=UPI0018F1638D|nr:TraB/GumN family protein [Luteimonas sp. MC1828]MBJ7574480.1 TraB/GumN family protein [Luteimonas sp. MC1828]